MTATTAPERPRDALQRARAAFWPCRSAEETRRAFAALWDDLAGLDDADLGDVLDEFDRALTRCGDGVARGRGPTD